MIAEAKHEACNKKTMLYYAAFSRNNLGVIDFLPDCY